MPETGHIPPPVQVRVLTAPVPQQACMAPPHALQVRAPPRLARWHWKPVEQRPLSAPVGSGQQASPIPPQVPHMPVLSQARPALHVSGPAPVAGQQD